jgi:Aspartyl protease
MTKASPLLVISLVLFGASNLQGEPQCPGNAATVRYHSLRGSQIAIPVTINGSGPYEFQVDTGSVLTIIDPALASELNIQPRGSTGLTAVSSHLQAQLAVPGKIEAASHSVAGLKVAISSLGQIQVVNPKLRGILGEDFLARFDLLIDYRHGLLCVDDSPGMREALRGQRIPLEAQPERPNKVLISAQLAGSSDVIFQLDSGASVPLVFKDLTDRDNSNEQAWMRPLVHSPTIGKQMQSFKVLPPKDVQIGKTLLREVEFLTPTVSPAVKPGEDGLLPTALFQRVFLSYAQHYAILDPK